MKDIYNTMTNTLSFNCFDHVPLGWVWVCKSTQIKKKKIRAFNLMGREIIIFRGEQGELGALDAYCPHMGAHLADGKVDGNTVRCFFHNWQFTQQGQCIDIPCLQAMPAKKITTQSFHVKEQYGLIWLWTGAEIPIFDVPCVPALKDEYIDFSLGNQWQKQCHPNVVMINAIDEHHFQTVHKMPGHILNMVPKVVNNANILFENKGHPSKDHWLGRLAKKFYRGPITYNLSYWNGIVGTVTVGPDSLQMHIMFALRADKGTTKGQTIAFTKHRKGLVGQAFNYALLQITKLIGYYFAVGDTKVFQKIQFDFKNPIKNDRSVIAFIKHLEKQPQANWHKLRSVPPTLAVKEIEVEYES